MKNVHRENDVMDKVGVELKIELGLALSCGEIFIFFFFSCVADNSTAKLIVHM